MYVITLRDEIAGPTIRKMKEIVQVFTARVQLYSTVKVTFSLVMIKLSLCSKALRHENVSSQLHALEALPPGKKSPVHIR
jgi:hypothetical protein